MDKGAAWVVHTPFRPRFRSDLRGVRNERSRRVFFEFQGIEFASLLNKHVF